MGYYSALKKVTTLCTIAVVLCCILPASVSAEWEEDDFGPRNLTYYIHSRSLPPNVTTAVVASPTGSLNYSLSFGTVFSLDQEVRAGASNTSLLLGREIGIINFGYNLLADITYTIQIVWPAYGYNGTLTISGITNFNTPVQEIPVVGGTGTFRLARGYTTDTDVTPADAPAGYFVRKNVLKLYYI